MILVASKATNMMRHCSPSLRLIFSLEETTRHEQQFSARAAACVLQSPARLCYQQQQRRENMRPSRKFLRFLCALSFAGGATLLALGLNVALTAHLHASAAALASLGGYVHVECLPSL